MDLEIQVPKCRNIDDLRFSAARLPANCTVASGFRAAGAGGDHWDGFADDS